MAGCFQALIGRGIPLTALAECQGILDKDSILHAAIAHHLSETISTAVAAVVCTPSDGEIWCQEIEESLLAKYPTDAEKRWWLGTTAGLSAASIFSVFSRQDGLKYCAMDRSKGATPKDYPDFKRCLNLLAIFPEWRARLPEVAKAYPKTAWPAIIDRRADIEADASPFVDKKLRHIHQTWEQANNANRP